MPDIFDDPDLAAAMASAGVVHTPGMAQDMLRELAPFLAEEGIDLSDPGDASLDTLNAAFARATERYNRSLPPVRPGVQTSSNRPPGKESPFIRRTTRQPTLSNADRSAVREFGRWLHRQPHIAAPSPADESGMLTELFKVALHHGFRLRTPAGVEDLVDLLFETEYKPEQAEDGALEAALDTLHDYVHFQQETSVDPSAWTDIHDLFEEPLPGADILQDAILDSEQLDPDVRRAALSGTHLVASVTELLGWIGSGRKVAPSGGLRRVDIAYAAGLLGIAAVGVDRRPADITDAPALIEIAIEAVRPAPDAIHARSMKDVPLLPSWWRALAAAQLIELTGTRVVPGPSAAAWTAESLPPMELAEEVVGLTMCEYIVEDLDVRPALFAEQVAAITLAQLIGGLTSEQVPFSRDENELERLLHLRATHHLQRLVPVGVLTLNAEGDVAIPHALRGAVARGVLTALALLGDAIQTD